MPIFTNYHTDQVIVTWQGTNINGFSNDTFVEVERDEDGFTTYVGVHGDVCRTQNLNRMGKITITLMASAPINSFLSILAIDDEDDGLSYGPIMVKDLSGTMLCGGAEAWLTKRPKIERSKESGTIQWVFAVAVLDIIEGGNVAPFAP